MIKNIQNTLLIKQPLLWNTKIISITIFALAIHIIFFVIGFAQGGVDFTETNSNYSSSIFNDSIIVFFSVLVSILLFIFWLVNFFKNNALKSFYPKNNLSLFKE
ncbi:MAG: hypothetical protein ACI9XR_001891 [Flavobacterium sp.]|jgi:hypothetical protein